METRTTGRMEQPSARSFWNLASGRMTGRAIVLALAITWMAPRVAAAAGLTEADYRYLKAEFGLGKDSFTLTNISPGDAAKLHELINERAFMERPIGKHLNVADYLYDVEMRTCQAWRLAHGDQLCPQVTDPNLVPGWRIAERNCNACHLTGTADAPSFFKLAQRGAVDENRLATVLHSGHRMSPITLSPEQLQALARYINSRR